MGLISRLRRITLGRIEAFLESVVDPERALPRLERELADCVEQAVRAEAKARTAARAAQVRVDEAQGRCLRLQRGAELALRQGDEALAREALTEQARLETELVNRRTALASSEKAIMEAEAARAQLQADLQALRGQRVELLARLSRTRAEQPRRSVDAMPSILEAVQRMEQRGDEEEARWETFHRAGVQGGLTVDERLRRLERQAEVEHRLALLKAKRAGAGGGTAGGELERSERAHTP